MIEFFAQNPDPVILQDLYGLLDGTHTDGQNGNISCADTGIDVIYVYVGLLERFQNGVQTSRMMGGFAGNDILCVYLVARCFQDINGLIWIIGDKMKSAYILFCGHLEGDDINPVGSQNVAHSREGPRFIFKQDINLLYGLHLQAPSRQALSADCCLPTPMPLRRIHFLCPGLYGSVS